VTLNGGDVTIEPTDNATTLALFRTGKLDGAWVPEPWVSRLVLEAGGHVLVDEASLWPDGRFATTELVVSTRFLSAHPDAVQGLVRGELDAIGYLTTQPAGARAAVNDQLRALTGKPLSDAVLTRALAHVTITDDPAAATLQPVADHAHSAGTLTRRPDLHGLLDLRILNRILASRGQPAVSDAGLGGR
jgi:NitT/TauT family transport system substrate-binding protein